MRNVPELQTKGCKHAHRLGSGAAAAFTRKQSAWVVNDRFSALCAFICTTSILYKTRNSFSTV